MASGAVGKRSGYWGRDHLDFHEEPFWVNAQELNACGLLRRPPCKLYHPRVPQCYVPCKKACVFTRRAGGGWPCRGPCVDVKNHEGDHLCREHWGVLAENCSADSPMDTRRTLEVHSICASNGCIPRWVVRRLTPKHPRGRRITLKISRKWETENPIPCAHSFVIVEEWKVTPSSGTEPRDESAQCLSCETCGSVNVVVRCQVCEICFCASCVRAGRLCMCQMAPPAIATLDSHAALHSRLPSLVASSGATQPGDVD